MKIVTQRERLALYLTAGIICLSIILNLLVFPVLAKSKNLNKEIALSRRKLEKYLAVLQRKDELKAQEGKLKSEGSSSDILSELENIARGSNIRIIDLRPQGAQNFGPEKEISVDLKAEGEIENYFKFIYEIERSPLFLKIRKFQLAAKPRQRVLEGVFSISQAPS